MKKKCKECGMEKLECDMLGPKCNVRRKQGERESRSLGVRLRMMLREYLYLQLVAVRHVLTGRSDAAVATGSKEGSDEGDGDSEGGSQAEGKEGSSAVVVASEEVVHAMAELGY